MSAGLDIVGHRVAVCEGIAAHWITAVEGGCAHSVVGLYIQ